jgi:Holliday junction DNA helicase RuvA subunit
MLATLKGEITEKNNDLIVIECSGVGYGLFVTFEDFGALEKGSKVKLYVYEHIRENAHDLYGFRLPETKLLFEQLLSVNGVGPKMALAILSTAGFNSIGIFGSRCSPRVKWNRRKLARRRTYKTCAKKPLDQQFKVVYTR